MKNRLLTIIALTMLAGTLAAQEQLTTVTGTVHGYALQVLPNHPFTITEVRRGKYIIPIRDVIDYTDSLGVLTFQVPRSNFTTFDTTKIHFVLDAPQYWNNGRGVWLIIPDAATAELSTLPPAQYLGPPGFAIVIPSTGNYGDSIRTADSLARVALDSASAARQDLLNAIAQLQAQLDTAGDATRAVIEADIAALYGQVATLSGQIADLSARVDTVGATARAALEADVAGKQDALSPEQLARIDSIIAAGTRVVITSVGKIRVISIDTTGLMLGDLYNNLVATVNNKLNSDTASVAAVMDAMYARSGGASVWTTGTNFVYRDGGVTIGGTESPWSYQAGVYIPRNIKQHPDSTARTGALKTPVLYVDSLGRIVNTDSVTAWKRTFIKEPEFIPSLTAGMSGEEGYVDIEMTCGAYLDAGVQVPFFEVVSDSSNGFFIAGIDYTVTFFDPYFGRGGLQRGYISDVATSATNWAWGVSVGDNLGFAAGLGLVFAPRSIDQGHTRYRAPLHLRGTNRAGLLRIFMRVKFISYTPTSSSTWYVKLENT